VTAVKEALDGRRQSADEAWADRTEATDQAWVIFQGETGG